MGFTEVNQPGYAYDAGALGTFANTELYFNSLKRLGPGQGYYPQPSKVIMIMHRDNIEAGKLFGLRQGFKVCTGALSRKFHCG